MESLASTISDTLSVFDLQNDLESINSITAKVQNLNSQSHQTIESFNNKLSDLQRQLENVRSSMDLVKSSDSSMRVKTSLIQLENDIFETARSLTTLTMEINTAKLSYNQDIKKLDELENELSLLKISFSSLPELNNVSNDLNARQINERTRIIKMKLYESIGLKIDFSKKEVLILNKADNKLRCLKIDDNYSEYFITNYIWDNM